MKGIYFNKYIYLFIYLCVPSNKSVALKVKLYLYQSYVEFEEYYKHFQN